MYRIVLFLALFVLSPHLFAQSKPDVAQLALTSLYGERWEQLVLDCYSKPTRAQESLDSLWPEIDKTTLDKSARDRLRSQLDALRAGVSKAPPGTTELCEKIRGIAKYVRAGRTVKIGEVRLLDDDRPEFEMTPDEQELLRSLPFLSIIIASCRLHDSSTRGNPKLLWRELKNVSEGLEVSPPGPYLDSLFTWRAAYLADVKGDLDGALTLVSEKAQRLEPFSKYGFGYSALRSEQARYGLLSGKRRDFIAGLNALDDLAKNKERQLLSEVERDLIRFCAPTYHRTLMNGKSCASTFAMLLRKLETGINPDFALEKDVWLLVIKLDFAWDLGEDHRDLARLATANLGVHLASKDQWLPTDFEAAMLYVLHQFYAGNRGDAEEWMKKILPNFTAKLELTPIDEEVIRTFRFLTDDLEGEELKDQIWKLLYYQDARFGGSGAAAARIRDIILLSRHDKNIELSQKLRIHSQCTDAINGSICPTGSVERLSWLMLGETLLSEASREADLVKLRELAAREKRTVVEYRDSLIAEATKNDLVKSLSESQK